MECSNAAVHTYIIMYVHTYILLTYIHIHYVRTYIHITYVRTYILRTYVRTYTFIMYVHAYIHITYVHTYSLCTYTYIFIMYVHTYSYVRTYVCIRIVIMHNNTTLCCQNIKAHQPPIKYSKLREMKEAIIIKTYVCTHMHKISDLANIYPPWPSQGTINTQSAPNRGQPQEKPSPAVCNQRVIQVCKWSVLLHCGEGLACS